MNIKTEHAGLPVSGYQPQSSGKVAVVNANKQLEERCLRQIEIMRSQGGHDTRMMALAFTGIQDAFMWLNRSVFQPSRIELPEDGQHIT